MRWEVVSKSSYPWIEWINQYMAGIDLPDLNGPELYVFSDYSGDHVESKFSVISFLIVDIDKCRNWNNQRKIVRKNHLPNNRRISYKTLNDKKQREALPCFLQAAGELPSICFSYLVDKRIRGLITRRNSFQDWKPKLGLQGKWKFIEFEKMARIVHFLSLTMAGLVTSQQGIVWISDQDSILANWKRKSDTSRLLSVFQSFDIPRDLSSLEIGTTELDEGDRLEEDFTAIPDLVAGALSDYFTRIANEDFWWDRDLIPQGVKPKSQYIVEWLMETPKNMEHVTFVFQKRSERELMMVPISSLDHAGVNL